MFKINQTSLLTGFVSLLGFCASVAADTGWADSPTFTVDNRAAIPAVSDWGLLALTLLFLAAASVMLSRRKADKVAGCQEKLANGD